jgi:hypothetical protein
LKKFVVFAFFIACLVQAGAQAKMSFGTDVSVLRNFSPDQQFFALGQTVQANIHLNSKTSLYSWFIYHSPGRFENNFKAVAKSSTTTPSQIDYKVKGTWNMREFSMGVKYFFKGAYDAEYGWNLYGIGGLGFMFVRAKNAFKPEIDTALYNLPSRPVSGGGTFNRLTVDLGLGGEIPLGGDFYIYGDARTFLPASSYPSRYLHANKNVPLSAMVNIGVRILFNY